MNRGEASAKDPGSAARNSTTLAAPGRRQEAAEFPTKHCSYYTWPDRVPDVWVNQASAGAGVDCPLGRPDRGSPGKKVKEVC